MTPWIRFFRHCEERSDEATLIRRATLHDGMFGLICLTLISFQTARADSAPF